MTIDSAASAADGMLPSPAPDFIVGIGASAGGVMALKQFFEHVPADSRGAFIVVLHLSPGHDSRLAEVLRSSTTLPVLRVSTRTRMQANHVYVIPPNRVLTVEDGDVVVAPLLTPEQRYAPVDLLLRTLAQTHGAAAVGVVLSGTGANGSNGIKWIKDHGGLVVVQDPSEAECPEMPRNSLATGLVDYMLPVGAMPQAIGSFFSRPAPPIPIGRAAAQEEVRPSGPPLSSDSSAAAVQTVLVVDADGDARERYSKVLAAAGHRLIQASDGRDGLVQALSVRPDVVVIDASLPYIDGLELCSLLHEDPLTASMRVILLTSEDAPEHVRRCQQRGAAAVLVKPVAIETLATAVRGQESDADRDAPSGRGNGSGRLFPVSAHSLAKARLHERYVSMTPPKAPPLLRCPQCDAVLQYERSHVGGVSDRHPEQWDYFACARHGEFQYRHRTRRLRPAS